jgi:hypothetical protein
MNCRSFRKHCVELLDPGIDSPRSDELRSHSQQCSECARFLNEMSETLAALQPSQRVVASGRFRERVMSRIADLETNERRGFSVFGAIASKRMWMPSLAVALAALVAAVALIPELFGSPSPSAKVLALASRATANLRSVHIQAQVRTLPYDNFALVRADCDFVEHDIWREFTNPPRWRVEKRGRVVVMDGKSQTLLVRPRHAVKENSRAGFAEWLQPLLDPQSVLRSEARLARAGRAVLTVADQAANDGSGKSWTILTVDAKARNAAASDWLKGSPVSEFDNRRTYRFDSQTHQLESIQVRVNFSTETVTVFETQRIDCNIEIDPKRFTLDLPKDVAWVEDPTCKENKAVATARMSPSEATKAFLQACADANWTESRKYCQTGDLTPEVKERLDGLEIVSIGEACWCNKTNAMWVPYRVRLRSGETKKADVPLRNDNPEKRWKLSGGF